MDFHGIVHTNYLSRSVSLDLAEFEGGQTPIPQVQEWSLFPTEKELGRLWGKGLRIVGYNPGE